MTAAAKAIAFRRLTRRALSLGAIKAFDKATQFLLPVVLVRCLDTATFGEYRLLWLLVGTVHGPRHAQHVGRAALFLPRAEPARKRLYVHQTHPVPRRSRACCAARWSARGIRCCRRRWRRCRSTARWCRRSSRCGSWPRLLDSLPTIDERIRWQAYATVGTSLLRTVLVGVGAWASGDIARDLLAAARGGGDQARAARRLRAAPPRLRRAVVRAQGVRRRSSGRSRRSAWRARCTRCARRPTSGSRRRCSPCTASPRFPSPRCSSPLVVVFRTLGARGLRAEDEPAAGGGRRARHARAEQPRQRAGRHAALPGARLRLRLRRGDRHPGLYRGLSRGGAGRCACTSPASRSWWSRSPACC